MKPQPLFAEHEASVLRVTQGRPRLLQVLGEGRVEEDTALVPASYAGSPLGKSQQITRRERGKRRCASR